ncbi:putative oxidoreductase [Penicillium taxi]|uniref:putative oxidoreductase n=1 Tax=Penicillium taxi TaxID=168475 RepID=UPI002545770D|nr:putative oxidoreductase [Penicillium taxi]KAJ5899661.1 putative oxidoreductase [Penicillium taxi]
MVPTLLVDGAFNEAVKGAAYNLHIASPIVLKGNVKPTDNNIALIEPAVAGSVAMGSPTIKHVVITSSIVTMVP